MGGDILDESFEGTGYENGENGVGSWSETVGNGVVDEDNTDVARPTGGGAQVLKIQKASSDYDAEASYDIGSDTAITYSTFYVMVNVDGLAPGGATILATGRNAASQVPWQLAVRRTAGYKRFQLSLYNNGSFVDYYFPAADDITFDQWYRMDIKYDNTGHTWEWRVDEDSKESGSIIGTHRTGPRYLQLGGHDHDYTLTAYFDLANIDSTGYVSFGVVTLEIDTSECEQK